MRIAIREQLAALVLVILLCALTIVAVPTWVYVNQFVINVESDSLSLTASLKASQISSDLELIQTFCYTISSRLLVQAALTDFYNNHGKTNWTGAFNDIQSALSVGSTTGLLQARLYSRNTTGGGHEGLLNVTAAGIDPVTLPYVNPDGTPVRLGDVDMGYPPSLYPNITYVNLGRLNKIRNNTTAYYAEPFPGVPISSEGGLMLGPVVLNETAALVSMSIPVRDNTDTFILGYMTVVSLSTSLISVRDSREGMGQSGIVLVVGPNTPWNRFNLTNPASNSTYVPPNPDTFGDQPVSFVLPPKSPPGVAHRHTKHSWMKGSSERDFPVHDYTAAFDAFSQQMDSPNNSSSILKAKNEEGISVSVGYARTQTPLVDWTIIVEKTRAEAWTPINTLQHILLGTSFGTAALIFIIIFPLAHLSVRPIRLLKAATERSIKPPGYEASSVESISDLTGSGSASSRSKKDIWTTTIRMLKRKPKKPLPERDPERSPFKIPDKVEETNHFVEDELTELTQTFNSMSEELLKQYVSLEEKVAVRTKELSESKKAAEAANESKTLFIANISHELKTPLNGILGMCAVCMEETNITRIKQSLKTLYKSGDLLLHLLEDLLIFSKNQIGHQLKIEEKDFGLADIRSQILTIFDKQVREGKINFSVDFVSANDDTEDASNDEAAHDTKKDVKLPALGPHGTGRLKDMRLWGDQHRILQVLINLVSNSLKFTPPDGKVQVRIKCLGEETTLVDNASRSSSVSKTSRTGRNRIRRSSGGSSGPSSTTGRRSPKIFDGSGTALSINPMEPAPSPYAQSRERSQSPPGPGTKILTFEFEVQDSGPGIPENMQQKVFEPFVQGDLGLSKKYGGTGLGLSICHQLAGLMGGTINLESKQGFGSKFTMHIPLKYLKERASSTASSSGGSRPASVDGGRDITHHNGMAATPKTNGEKMGSTVWNPQPRLVGLNKPFFAADSHEREDLGIVEIEKALTEKKEGKLRVLVADDNSTNIEVVSRMLKLEAVYNVTIAHDGQEAYDLVKATMERNEAYDVIFMDVQMPNLDGLQSTRLIRGMGYTSPIVALTAFSEESNVKDCIASGMNEFLSKPIRRPALQRVLQKFATIVEENESSHSSKSSEQNESPSDDQRKPFTEEIEKPDEVQVVIKEKADPLVNGTENGHVHTL